MLEYRIFSAFEEFLDDECCFDEFFGTRIINNDTFQHSQAKRTQTINGDTDNRYSESIGASMCHQNQRRTTVVGHSHTTNHDQLSANLPYEEDLFGPFIDWDDQPSSFKSSGPNSHIPYCNQDDSSARQTESTPQRAQQRMEINQNWDQQLSNIAEESMTIALGNEDVVIKIDISDISDDLELTSANDNAIISPLSFAEGIQPNIASDTNIQTIPPKSTIDEIEVRVYNDSEREQDARDIINTMHAENVSVCH